MIGIIGAMDVEVNSIISIIENKKEETVSGVKFVSGQIFGKDVVIACCGIGKVFAAICAEAMILKFAPDVIINSGVAGTLTNKLNIFDVAISKNVVQHDMDTTPLGDPKGMLSGINLIEIPACEKYIELTQKVTKELGINSYVGNVVSGDQFINNNEKKKELAQQFNGVCCEMEGGSIGHVCHVNNTDFVVIRAISDGADDTSDVDFPTFVAKASENSFRILKEFIKNV